MATIYLSPATYLNDVQTECHSPEQRFMHSLADFMESHLADLAIPFHRRSAEMDNRAAIDASNAEGCDLHLALHSGLAPDSLAGALRGITVLHAPDDPESTQAAKMLAERLREIYPLPRLVRTQASKTVDQIAHTNSPAVVLELGFRDNAADASWLQHNRSEIARTICQSIEAFLAGKVEDADPKPVAEEATAPAEEAAVPVFAAMSPQRGIVRAPFGSLVIREAPEDTAPILATAANRTAVTVLDTTGDWQRLQLGGMTGYARRDFIALI